MSGPLFSVAVQWPELSHMLQPAVIGLEKSKFTTWAEEEPKSQATMWGMVHKMTVFLVRRMAVG